MRLCCVIAAMCLLPSIGSAQTGLRSASLPDHTPTNPAPSPQMLRSASLPDREPMQPVPPPRTDRFLAGPHTYSPPPDCFRGRHCSGAIGFGYGYAPYLAAAPEPRDLRPELQNGYLHLQVLPGYAQVHVDGYYMGTVDDFRRLIPGRSLEAGPHRVELRAPGYQSATFDVRILPNETITYRSDLDPTRTSEKPLMAPGVPKTFYVIPGCYAGDKPPRGRLLPRGCDASKVRTIPPRPVFLVKR
jgi:hypothetical protein